MNKIPLTMCTTLPIVKAEHFSNTSLKAAIFKNSFIMKHQFVLMVLLFLATSILWGQNLSPIGYEFEHPWTYSDIQIRASVANVNLPLTDEYSYVQPDGIWSISYILSQAANVKNEFMKNRFCPSIRNIPVQYFPTGIVYNINPVTMMPMNLQNIIVSQSGVGSFETIQDAVCFVYDIVESSSYDGTPFRIKVMQGIYEESIDLSPLTWYSLKDFSIEGIGEVTIDGLGFEYCINLEYPYINPLEELMDFKIININMTNAKHGVYFKDLLDEFDDYAPHGKLTIRNCGFQNCGGTAYEDTFGGGVHFSGAGSIENNVFADNSMDNNQWVNSNRAGALYLHNDSSAEADVKGNTFTDNTGGFAGALVATGSGRIWVRGNYFEDNIESGFVSDRKTGNSLSVYDVSKISITNNVFIDNRSIPGQSSGKEVALYAYAAIHSDVEPIIFENNTLISSNQTNLLTFWHSSNNAIQDIEIRNNVFSNTGQGNSTVSSLNYGNPTVEYNIFHDTVPTGFAGNFSTTNIEEDPKFDANHQPIWTASTMSPCIDTGYGDPDPDDTPRDIGAKTAQEHVYREYSYANPSGRDRWHWVSYPVLNSLSNDALQASEFFKELLVKHQDGGVDWYPTCLDTIVWRVGGEEECISWYNENWTDSQYSHYISSPQGYKVKLKQDFWGTVTLKESGFKAPESLQFPIYSGMENWLGYFKEDSALANEAFADIWDDIDMVRGKSWSLLRDSNGLLTGKMGTLHYGDMVSIITTNNHTFQWGSSNPTPPDVKSMPQHFDFDEKHDYIPVYVSLPDSLMLDLKEIGLYLDGVCKGAVVVESNYEQISAYVDSEGELADSDLELVFHYDDSKRPDQQLRTTSYTPGRLQTKYGVSGSRYPYYEIAIDKEDLGNIIPAELSLQQNYPNPFNPTTTISYSLPEAGKIRLDIYNLKGQLLTTIVNADQEAGKHSVTWNGTDTKGQSVASGVYFYRLSSPHKTLTKRMLLMK